MHWALIVAAAVLLVNVSVVLVLHRAAPGDVSRGLRRADGRLEEI